MIHSILADKATRLYIILGAFFVANALIAEMVGVKLFQLETALGLAKADFSLLGQDHLSFVLSVGVLPWPIVFIMTDVVTDYYGVRGVRFLTLITAALIAFAFAMMYFAMHIAPAGFWITSSTDQGVPDMQAAFANIFGQGMNIILGSLAAFITGLLFRNVEARAVIATILFGAVLYAMLSFAWPAWHTRHPATIPAAPHFLHLMFVTLWSCVAFALALNRFVFKQRAVFELGTREAWRKAYAVLRE